MKVTCERKKKRVGVSDITTIIITNLILMNLFTYAHMYFIIYLHTYLITSDFIKNVVTARVIYDPETEVFIT